jgi:Family of unknown function (DUF6364)
VSNLTLTIDEQVLRRARIKALEQGTSVNALVREYLEQYTDGAGRQAAARARLLELSDQFDAGSGPQGRAWTREQIYDDALGGGS